MLDLCGENSIKRNFLNFLNPKHSPSTLQQPRTFYGKLSWLELFFSFSQWQKEIFLFIFSFSLLCVKNFPSAFSLLLWWWLRTREKLPVFCSIFHSLSRSHFPLTKRKSSHWQAFEGGERAEHAESFSDSTHSRATPHFQHDNNSLGKRFFFFWTCAKCSFLLKLPCNSIKKLLSLSFWFSPSLTHPQRSTRTSSLAALLLWQTIRKSHSWSERTHKIVSKFSQRAFSFGLCKSKVLHDEVEVGMRQSCCCVFFIYGMLLSKRVEAMLRKRKKDNNSSGAERLEWFLWSWNKRMMPSGAQ